MWYVVQVFSGREQKACDLILRTAAEHPDEGGKVLKECFVPKFQLEQKFKGEYRTIERCLFPGYVVALTSDVNALNRLLATVPDFTRLLGSGESFVPLDQAEMGLINAFTQKDFRTVRVSRAVAEGDGVKIVDGPLVGHEGNIAKINRRKGTARVEIEMFGRTVTVELGLSVVSKVE